MDEVLAFGGELKNTFCLTKGRYAILSQHIGDLENYETMQFFEETLANLKHVFKVVPRAVAYDLHPSYMSTRMAMASTIERKIGAAAPPCPHRELHRRRTICEAGFWACPDGTGFGTDGRIWGANFWLPILPGSPGGHICATSYFQAATQRCGSPGAWC